MQSKWTFFNLEKIGVNFSSVFLELENASKFGRNYSFIFLGGNLKKKNFYVKRNTG